jgi:hypothetical protein
MKVITVTDLVRRGEFPTTAAFRRGMRDIRQAIDAVRWPPDAPGFTIHPQKGKRRGEGNGVKPIKTGFVTKLKDLGWRLEERYRRTNNITAERDLRPGAFDAWLDLSSEDSQPFVVEWETGNISSSHRSLNKMAQGLVEGKLAGGVLVLPTRELAQYLTDRIGNYPEIEPYFPLWMSLPVSNGYLGVVAVEHDAASVDVPRITKGTDGRALI